MPLKYIFHLSDLHIRNGDKIYCRYEEYNLVFNNTIESIKLKIETDKLEFNDYITIITGDIFHNKNNIGNYGLLLYKTFIEELTKISKVYILAGNHDLCQGEISQPSLVYSSSFNIENLIILNESQSFIIDNIGFSFVSIENTLDTYKNSGRIQDLPSFPEIKGDVKYKIALFHGSFVCAKLYNGDEMKEEYNPYPLEWVKDFDYVLLGDIHKRQLFNYKKNTICGYSGSLIQQNFGEDIIDHGYLFWDLFNKKIKEINVYNNIGYINIKEDDNENILIRKNGKYECPLEKEINDKIEYFPKQLEIKVFSKINFEKLNTLLKTYNINFTIICRSDERYLNLKNPEETEAFDISKDLYNKEKLDNIIDNNYILEYFNKILTLEEYNKFHEILINKELLLFDVNKYPEELLKECNTRNKDLLAIINSCIKNNDIKEIKNPFTIRYLEWEGLLCYENKNWLNIHDLDNKSFLVKGKNGTGKSAIYDILLLAIWGENTKYNSLSGGIINYNKKSGYTIIDIELDGQLYRIQRDFIRKANTNKLNNNHSILYEFINDKDLIFLAKDSKCNQEVNKLFGDIETFLSSSMITQNVDYNILKMDAKDTLKLIDKSFNVEYIYNLYDLFKTAINKYKDFRKIINSKKEVYEKLVSNSKIEIVDSEAIEKTNEQLTIKKKEKEELEKLFDDINIDVKDPKNLIILETDYDELISKLDQSKLISSEDYSIYKERYNELKFILKDIINDEKELLKLKESYTDNIKLKIDYCVIKTKPCELSLIENERKLLLPYLNKLTEKEIEDIKVNGMKRINSNNEEIMKLEKSLSLLKDEYLKIENREKESILIKPSTTNNHLINKEELLKQILNIFVSIEELKEHHSNIKQINTKETNGTKEINTISYNDYKKQLVKKTNLEKNLELIGKKIILLEKDFQTTFKKQQSLTIINKPLTDPLLTNTKTKTLTNIIKEIKSIDIKKLSKQIEEDDNEINYYNNILEKIDNLYDELNKNKKELLLLTTSDEYKYNPECKICCARPWVSKIKELEKTIKKIDNEILEQCCLLENEDYNILISRNENNKKTKDNYNVLLEWKEYLQSKNEYDKITKELNKIVIDKTELNKLVLLDNEQIIEINKIINYFNDHSTNLYNQLISIEDYENFKKWEDSYNELIMIKNETITNIKLREEEINYNKNIKPRLYKYLELKDTYDKWNDYDKYMKILNTNELFKLKDILDEFDKLNEYIMNNNKKPLIKEKLELNESIKLKEKEIKTLNDSIIKQSTMNNYNNENKNNYNKLLETIYDIDNIINILEKIIHNFQAFRIEMYDKYILNKLTTKTNKIIKSLCHKETKPFKLDYIITVVKDIIHINWLINNEVSSYIPDRDVKQIISVSQASGFQHFAISLALRMSLFMNKYENQCNQLFIDEGFVNFDENNLSIVPSFLKSLLSYFSNIIIVSHINLIQGNVDETAEIKFDKSSSVSNMTYNSSKKTIVKRTRK